MDLTTPLGAGMVAGLALAAPLGAIGVLLIREGATRGLRGAAPAAVAVATADVLYCLAVLSAGTVMTPLIVAWGAWPRVVAGAVLVAFGGWGLVRAASRGRVVAPKTRTSDVRATRLFATFFALTTINPATLVYFTALVAGSPTALSSPGARARFVAGVALASLGWQLLLVGSGAAARRSFGVRFGRVSSLLGNAMVAVLGTFLIVRTILP